MRKQCWRRPLPSLFQSTFGKATLLSFIILFHSSLCFAQNSTDHFSKNEISKSIATFSHFDLEDGLSQRSVSAMVTDKEGYIWIGTQDGLNRFDGYEFQVFRNIPNDSTSLSSNYITDLLLDEKDNLWIGTLDGGLNYLDKSTGNFTRYIHRPNEPNSLNNDNIQELEIDEDGNLWVGTLRGVSYLKMSDNKFQSFENKLNPLINRNKIFGLLVDSQKRLWISTRESLNIYDLENNLTEIKNIPTSRFYSIEGNNKEFSHFPGNIIENKDGEILLSTTDRLFTYNNSDNNFKEINLDLSNPVRIYNIYIDQNNGYWVSTQSSLLHIDSKNKDSPINLFHGDETKPESIKTGSKLTAVTEDINGGIWIGTWAGGLNQLKRRKNLFSSTNRFSNRTEKETPATALYSDSAGALWAGTFGYGLSTWQLINGEIKSIDLSGQLPETANITHISKGRNNNFWICTALDGLYEYALQARKTTVYKSTNEAKLSADYLQYGLEDSNGDLWASTYDSGLMRRKKGSDIFEKFTFSSENPNSISSNTTRTIFEDSKKRVWITSGNGLNLYNRSENNFTQFHHDENNPRSILQGAVNTIMEDKMGNLWIGTYSGLSKLENVEKGIFKNYTSIDGLTNNVVCAIEEDEHSRLWISTFNGISCFEPKKEKFINYNTPDGTLNQEFNTTVSTKNKETGEIYFGGSKGITYFQPDDFTFDTTNSKITITTLTTYDSDGGQSQAHFISSKKEYNFPNDEKIIQFKIAGLSFKDAGQQKYKYQLRGFNEQWYNLGQKREIIFTNLNPGNYQLLAKVANSDEHWSEPQHLLTFNVHPPWYKTWWAISIWTTTLFSILYAFYNFQLSKKTAEKEADRLKELDEFKTRFYANITHEFRTPLTVISGMADELENQPQKEAQKKISLIKKNSFNLLNLVNQMLDLSRLQAGQTIAEKSQSDIIIFLSYLVEALESLAKLKNIGLQFYTEEKELAMDFDAKNLETVINNLIGNAIKFTPEYGKILVVAKQYVINGKPFLEIKIKDNGIGISEEQLPYIFNRFHQANPLHENQGSGIGLALVKELIKMMEGKIDVESELGKGTVFHLHFPISNHAPLVEVQPKIDSSIFPGKENVIQEESKVIDSDLPILLIIEDNSDVIYYLQTCLENDYQIVTSRNGKKGIKKAKEILPDIIISDVMMPEADGLEVCADLKSDERTSHIPIILLTAKATSEDKLKGLSLGADAYLIKPFEKDELMVRLDQLTTMRRTLQNKYQTGLVKSQPKEETPSSREETFVEKIENIILSNLENENFSVHELSRELLLSRSQVHRKIKALTGMSTAVYIRFVRLQKAKELLTNTQLSISEIAYQVGFKTPVYFSQAYKDVFSESPSATRK